MKLIFNPVDALQQPNTFTQQLTCIGDVTHLQCVLTPEFNRIDLKCVRQLIHERLNCEA